MEVVKREYQVFNFNELSEEAKDKAIADHYEYEYEYGYTFLEDDIREELHQIDNYFSDVELQYSLAYCQGDGLSFKGKFDLDKFLNNRYRKKLKKSVRRALSDYIYNIHSKGNTGHYCYAHKNDIEYDYNYQDSREFSYLEKIWQQVLEDIQKYYLNLCHKLERYGYDILEYRMTYDEFDEYCEANEHRFYESGKLFNL